MKATAKGIWKWLMDLVSEKKDGASTGTPSVTRVLTLACFLAWVTVAVLEGAGVEGVEMPDTLQYTMWGMLGLKGVDKGTKNLKGSGG